MTDDNRAGLNPEGALALQLRLTRALLAQLKDRIRDHLRSEKEQAEQARADLSRCSRRIALMLAPMFPGEGILASLTVSHDSAVARIKYLVNAEAALREICELHASHVWEGESPAKLEEAIDTARSMLHYDRTAR